MNAYRVWRRVGYCLLGYATALILVGILCLALGMGAPGVLAVVFGAVMAVAVTTLLVIDHRQGGGL